jgi:hypothetical protein
MIPDLTFVCSHGRTATKWLTAALDCHPDIAASHGPVSPPVFSDDNVPYEEALRRGWTPNAFHSLSLDQMAVEMSGATPKRFKARVHALNAFELIDRVRKERPHARISAVNIIRHPITRIASFQSSWAADWNFSHDLQNFMTDVYHHKVIVRELLKAMEDNGFIEPKPMDQKLFLCAIAYIAYDMRDFGLGLPTFMQERLTSDIEYWTHFLRVAFGPTLDIPFTHLRNVQGLGAHNVTESGLRSSMEVYANWAPWQKFAFQHFALTYHVAAMYRPYGYVIEP